LQILKIQTSFAGFMPSSPFNRVLNREKGLYARLNIFAFVLEMVTSFEHPNGHLSFFTPRLDGTSLKT
jgi:hypothetical protein